MASKICTKCETEKSLEEFYSRAISKDGKNGRCIPCVRLEINGWREKNPEKARESRARYKRSEKGKVVNARIRRDYHFKSRYGMTLEGRNQMITDQDGLCAICSRELDLEDAKKTCVDHDHETNKVRGILCRGCNRGLGFFEDNPDILEQAAKYLREKCLENVL